MGKLSHDEFIKLLIAIGLMLFFARLAAELAKAVKLPVITGEILAGIIIGPSVFGHYYPSMYANIFPLYSNVGVALDGLIKLSSVLLLFVSGMEVQMNIIMRQGKAAIFTSVFSMIIPFAVGWYVADNFPEVFKMDGTTEPMLFSLFMGTAMAISALPVIAKTLMDLNIFRTKLGMIIIAAAMFDDLVGWLIFSLIISLMGTGKEMDIIFRDIGIILGYGIFMLTIGKLIIDRSLPWVQRKMSWPGGVISLSLSLCVFSAAFTESLGIHAVLGAFIAGIAVGDSVKLKEKAREIIHQFITNIFAPLFFVSIGLKVDFVGNFNLNISLIILAIAIVGKVAGASIGARLGGFTARESLAVGFGLNSRGAMEIILGTLALQAKLINEQIFVALVVMALTTSLMSGPMLKWVGKFSQN